MKKFLSLLLVCALLLLCACGDNNITENRFFRKMTHIQKHPEQYVGAEISFDAFTYELTDTSGESHICVARHCSSGYGCNCGKDTIIGFLIEYDGQIPAPRNQSTPDNDKTWVHVSGTLKSTNATEIQIYAIDGTEETITFFTLVVNSLELIQDYSGLHYYVDK